MANEITITVRGSLNNSTGTGASRLNRTYEPGTASITQVTKKRGGHGQALTASWEAVDLGDVTAGYAFLQNSDATYNVDYGPLEAGSGGEGVLLGTIRPGDPPVLIPVPAGVTIMVRASGGSGATADVDVECWSQ